MNPDPPDSVRRLRQRLRNGDPEAFAVLFRDHVTLVHRVASGLCGDVSLAEDVVSETFLAAWRNRTAIMDTTDPLGPWLLAIATRQSLNVTRGRWRQLKVAARQGQRLELSSPDIAETVSSRLDDAELLRLSRARARLRALSAPDLPSRARASARGVVRPLSRSPDMPSTSHTPHTPSTPSTDDPARDALVLDLRHLLPQPPSEPLSPQAHQRLEAELAAAIAAESVPRWAPRRIAERGGPLVLVAACLTLVAGLGVAALRPTDPSPSSRPDSSLAALPIQAGPAAVRALDGLTSVALRTAVPRVGEDQFVYVRSTVISNEGTWSGGVTLGAPHEREIWLSQAARTADLSLVREDGQDWPFGGDYIAPAGPERPTYPWLTSLPADPDELLAVIGQAQHHASPITAEQYTFERIGDILSEGLVPSELSGALFQALTKIAGIDYVPDVEDAIGRHGFGISRTDEFSRVTSMWVFRADSPVPLGTKWFFSAKAPGRGPGVLFGATAVLERGVADTAGVRPPTPVAAIA